MPSELRKIRKICNDFNLFLIEDNAQAPSAMCGNKFTGSFGDIAVYSLNSHKTIQCGEGGVATTPNTHLIHKLRLVRNHSEAVYDGLHEKEKKLGGKDIIGFNYRLTCLQAGIAIPQIKKLNDLNQKRINLANYLSEKISTIDFLKGPKIRENCTHVYYLYPIIFDAKKAKISKKMFIERMSNEGAPISEYAPPIYTMSLFNKSNSNSTKEFSVTKKVFERLLITSICRPPLTRKHIDMFYNAIIKSSKT